MPVSINRREFMQSSSALAVLSALGVATSAEAQAIDTLKIVTGFAAGGTSDTTCRRLGEKLRGTYAKNTVVENRTGAGGQIVIQSMKTAAPDGTTLMQTPMSMLGIYPHIYKKLPYDPIADVMPVSLAAVFDFALAVGPAVPASVADLISCPIGLIPSSTHRIVARSLPSLTCSVAASRQCLARSASFRST